MTTYILHGGMLRFQSESNDSYFRRIVDAVPENGSVLIALFAAEEGRWPELFENLKALALAQAGSKALNFVLASREHFMEEVSTADAVVMRGGSTNRLLEALRAYPLGKDSFDGKLVTGSSAGAYVIGTWNYDKSERSARAGLGFLPVKVVCHYQSDDAENHTGDDAVKVMEGAYPELPLIVLKDCEWREFTV